MHTHALRTWFAALALLALPNAAMTQIIYIDDSGKGPEADNASHFVRKGTPRTVLRPVAASQVRLLPGLFKDHYELNRKYMMALEPAKLLQNFYAEAGLNKEYMVGKDGDTSQMYWGWESPMGQLRGHFLGHYLSACAYMWAETGDAAIKQRADFIVSELARCQRINGGEWVGSIPEKYLYLMADGQPMWSPQYTLHKTLMGLYDMYAVAGNQQALEVLDKMADWMYRWTSEMIEKKKTSAILNGETSGMLEIWASMYGLTGKEKYRELMDRYGHPWLFTQLLKGEDALSLDHCNASVPWSHGSARCYEVTGDDYWRTLTEDFWKCAVHEREQFATGGQNAGEHWIPKGRLADFAGENNQEHCTVYNLMRTAEYLYKWTGNVEYADYVERNLYNGILAQQHPQTGMVAYFLPMASGYKKGGEKGWGDPTMDFYCCHGTLVQAQTRYPRYIYFEHDGGLTVSQYIPSTLSWNYDSIPVSITQDFEGNQWNKNYDAPRWRIIMQVKTDKPVAFSLKVRLPWWLDKKASITINGNPAKVDQLHGYATINRTWNDDKVVVEFADRLWTEPLPGSKTGQVAFMEGPIVLAAPTGETPLKGDARHPEGILTREYDQQYATVRWTQSHYRTLGQEKLLRFRPLYEIADETYTIYFPVKK